MEEDIKGIILLGGTLVISELELICYYIQSKSSRGHMSHGTEEEEEHDPARVWDMILKLLLHNAFCQISILPLKTKR